MCGDVRMLARHVALVGVLSLSSDFRTGETTGRLTREPALQNSSVAARIIFDSFDSYRGRTQSSICLWSLFLLGRFLLPVCFLANFADFFISLTACLMSASAWVMARHSFTSAVSRPS